MNTLAYLSRLPAPATWGLIVAVVVIAVVLYLGRGKIDNALRWILIAIAVILFVLWLLSILPIGDTTLP